MWLLWFLGLAAHSPRRLPCPGVWAQLSELPVKAPQLGAGFAVQTEEVCTCQGLGLSLWGAPSMLICLRCGQRARGAGRDC